MMTIRRTSSLSFQLAAKAGTRWSGSCRRTSLVIAACLSATLTGPSLAGETNVPSADARAMNALELYLLYRDKTWVWPDGAGRFDDQGRRFTAQTGSGNATTWAQGRWAVTDDGKMCLIAEWHMNSGVHANKTCFSHKRNGGTIYQKKEPSGDWYIFKHTAPIESDEFKKLVAENLVSRDLATMKSDLEDQNRLAGNATPGRRKTQ